MNPPGNGQVHAAPRGFPGPQAVAADAAADGTDAAVNLLWTGGWDSTFQLLRLLFVHRRRVAPYYLLDEKRPSTDVEIATMDAIRARIARHDPQAAQRLLPSRHFRVAELAHDADITGAFEHSVRRSFMGGQYAWLAAFCRQHGIGDMQLCIHRDDKAHAVVAHLVTGRPEPDGHSTYRLDPQHAALPQHTLFAPFSLPLLDFSKLDMATIADAHGWTEFMRMTWFCHRPRRDGQPCGRCNPCLYTIDEGLGWRLPPGSRAAAVTERGVVRPLKAVARFLRGRSRGEVTLH